MNKTILSAFVKDNLNLYLGWRLRCRYRRHVVSSLASDHLPLWVSETCMKYSSRNSHLFRPVIFDLRDYTRKFFPESVILPPESLLIHHVKSSVCHDKSFSAFLESSWNGPLSEIVLLNYYFFVVLIIPPGLDFEQKCFWISFMLKSLVAKLNIRTKECIDFHLWIHPLKFYYNNTQLLDRTIFVGFSSMIGLMTPALELGLTLNLFIENFLSSFKL